MKLILFILTLLSVLVFILHHYGFFEWLWNKIKRQPEDEQLTPIEEDAVLSDTQLKVCLDMNNTWIGVADQKAGILLATMGVAFTVLLTSDAIKTIRNILIIPYLKYQEHPDLYECNFSRCVMFVYLIITGITAVISLIYLLNVIRPNINYKKFYKDNPGLVSKSYIYYSSVAGMKYVDYKTGKLKYEEDLRSQVFVNATIADKKYKNYLEGFFWFKMMILTAAMLFISVLFVN